MLLTSQWNEPRSTVKLVIYIYIYILLFQRNFPRSPIGFFCDHSSKLQKRKKRETSSYWLSKKMVALAKLIDVILPLLPCDCVRSSICWLADVSASQSLPGFVSWPQELVHLRVWWKSSCRGAPILGGIPLAQAPICMAAGSSQYVCVFGAKSWFNTACSIYSVSIFAIMLK